MQVEEPNIVVPYIQNLSTARIVIVALSILAATFRALTSFLLPAFINDCKDETK